MWIGWTTQSYIIPLHSYGRLVWGLLPFLQVNMPRNTLVESYQQAGQSDPLWFTLILAMIFTWHSYIAPVSTFRYTLFVLEMLFIHSVIWDLILQKPRGLTECDCPPLHTHTAPAHQLPWNLLRFWLPILISHSIPYIPLVWVEAVPYQVINLVTLHIVTYITLKNWPMS